MNQAKRYSPRAGVSTRLCRESAAQGSTPAVGSSPALTLKIDYDARGQVKKQSRTIGSATDSSLAYTYSIAPAKGGLNVTLTNYTSVVWSGSYHRLGSHQRSTFGPTGTTRRSHTVRVRCHK